MTETYTYDAFGTLTYIQSLNEEGVLAQADTTVSRFLYAGEQYDEVSGLYYLRARRYDTTVGRFTQEDMYLGDGRNLYVYVQNNPLKYVDPSGHCKGDNNYTSIDMSQMLYSAYGTSDFYFIQTGLVLGPVYWEAIQEAELIDYVQAGLDVIGLIPGFGEPADAINGCISLERGNYFDAAMSFGAVIPVAGIIATGAKGVKKVATPAVKVFKEMLGSLKYLDEANDGRKALEAAIETGTDALQYVDEFTEAVIEGGSKTTKELMSESSSAMKWGSLGDGTNQGVKHFNEYWDAYPERIPSLEKRLGLPEGTFENTLEGFNNFTEQAERVVREATEIGNVRNINGKTIYYIDGMDNPKKGVVVIMKDGKLQSMMPSDYKSFNKMQ